MSHDPKPDITERLRERRVTRWVHSTGTAPHSSGYGQDAECVEAANTIDALREANERFGKRQAWWTDRMFELEQERDALRAEADDICAELHQRAMLVRDDDETAPLPALDLLRAALDERDALRAEVERLRERPGDRIGGKVLGDLARENERLEAEVKRLRAELQRVQAYINETPDLFEELGPVAIDAAMKDPK